MQKVWLLRAFFLSLMIASCLVSCSEESKQDTIPPGNHTFIPEQKEFYISTIEPLTQACFKATGRLRNNSRIQYHKGACEDFKASYVFTVREIDHSQIRNIRSSDIQFEILKGDVPVGRIIAQRSQGERGFEYWVPEFCSGTFAKSCSDIF